MKPILLAPTELQPGDIVRLNPVICGNDPFQDHIIEQITLEGKLAKIRLFRPYMICTDFTSTSGVITYIGHAQWDAFKRIDDAPEFWFECVQLSGCAEVAQDRAQIILDKGLSEKLDKGEIRLEYAQALYDAMSRTEKKKVVNSRPEEYTVRTYRLVKTPAGEEEEPYSGPYKGHDAEKALKIYDEWNAPGEGFSKVLFKTGQCIRQANCVFKPKTN